MSKLIKISILFPTNTIIYINYNYLIIKGPFGMIIKKIFENSLLDLFSNIISINIKYFNTIFNNITLNLENKKYIFYKKNYHFLLMNIIKYIDIVSTGFLSILQIWGIGYKILKKNNFIYIYLGYSHIVSKILIEKINIKPFEGTYFFITSHYKNNLLLSSVQLKNLKKKDIYKGKGIRFLNEKIKLKIGKRD